MKDLTTLLALRDQADIKRKRCLDEALGHSACIETITEEIARLTAQMEAEKQGHPHVGRVYEHDQKYWCVIQAYDTGLFRAVAYVLSGCDDEIPFALRTKEAAEAWADALNTMLLLRVQPGACGRGEKGSQYTIWVDEKGLTIPGKCYNPSSFMLSGAFDCQESAQAAIANVGEDRIRRAAHTLAGKVS